MCLVDGTAGRHKASRVLAGELTVNRSTSLLSIRTVSVGLTKSLPKGLCPCRLRATRNPEAVSSRPSSEYLIIGKYDYYAVRILLTVQS